MRDCIPVETMTPEEFNRWYTARCVRVRATRVCVFCGKAIPPITYSGSHFWEGVLRPLRLHPWARRPHPPTPVQINLMPFSGDSP